MGCLKLTYNENQVPLKVVYRKETAHEKMCGNFTYFGARYYDADLSVWLSVDPMADKYPNVSAFMYCMGNPIKFIDPNGMNIDEWEINKKGQIVNRIENKNEDSFHIVDDNGKRTGESIKFDYRTVKDELKENFQLTTGEQENLFAFEIDSERNADKLFDFMADPQNTNKEWAKAKTDDNRYFVGNTTGDNDVSMANYLMQVSGYNLTSHTHSHLPTSLAGPNPSFEDFDSKRHFTPNCMQFIYFPSNKNSVDKGLRISQ